MTSLRSRSRAGKRPPRRPLRPARATRDRDRTAVRQGLSILAVLIVAASAIFFLDPIQRWLAEGPELVVTGPRSRSLEIGAEVWVAGTKAGRVTSVDFRPPEAEAGNRVVIRAVLKEDAAPHVREGARAWIQPSALLAPTVLVIMPGPPGAPPFDFADTLRVEDRVTAEELMARAREVREELDTLRAAGQRLIRELERGDGTLARLRRDTALRRTLRRDIQGLRHISAALGNEPGFARLMEPGAASTVDSILSRGGRVADALAARGPALETLSESLASLQRRARRLDSMMAAGRGSAGRFVADEELRTQIEALREAIPRTREALFSNPFRWLRIRLF